MLKSGKNSISEELAPILQRIDIAPEGWLINAKSQGRLFHRIIGKIDCIKIRAAQQGKYWFQGMSSAKIVFAS